ncbi:MAG: hypothetical protein KDJ15_03515 [Alphaproteobacteria bacterium]|nr:hypothetical protein [Alphaproteobacteria bacterium]
MTFLEQKLNELEARPVQFDQAEQNRRVEMFQHFAVINRFEGIAATPLDERLFSLLAAGKISKPEYLDLCLRDAQGVV